MVDRGRLDYCQDLSFVDARIRSHTPSEKIGLLHSKYEPGYWDVICQGGKESYEHIGNRRFRVCIDNNLGTYEQSKSKHEKSIVVTVVVDAVRESSMQQDGGFVRKDPDTGRWYEVGDKVAREKVGHALRDAIKLRSKQAKQANKASGPESSSSSRPAKRRRTESRTIKNVIVEEKERIPKLQDEVPSCIDVPRTEKVVLQAKMPIKKVASAVGNKPSTIDEDPLLVSDGTDDDWEESVQAVTEPFSAYSSTNNRSLSDREGPDDEGFVLTIMALQTISDKSNSSGGEDAESAYQQSIREMQLAEDIDSKLPSKPKLEWKPPGDSGMDNDFDTYMRNFVPRPFDAPKSRSKSFPKTKLESKPVGCCSKVDDEFEACMQSFGPTPIRDSSCKSSAASKPKFAWNPPGDSSIDHTYQLFSKQLQASVGNSSAQVALNFSKPAMHKVVPHCVTSGMTPSMQTLSGRPLLGSKEQNLVHKIGNVPSNNSFSRSSLIQNRCSSKLQLSAAAFTSNFISDD